MNETQQGLGTSGVFCAFLRLRQGASSRATWILEESPDGSMISVGADEACDWQLRAAFVPPRAFSVLVVGGRTFVRSGPEPGVLLDGKPVADGWVQVPHGGRIDIGLARLEVTMGYADTAVQLAESLFKVDESSRRTVSEVGAKAEPERQVGRTTMTLGAMPMQPIVAAPMPAQQPQKSQPLQQTQEQYEQPLLTRAAPKRRNATIELTMADLDFEPDGQPRPRIIDTQLEAAAPQARLLRPESGEYQVGARARKRGGVAPSLLDLDEPTDNRRWWMYAVAGAATVGAYGGWLVLLDHL